MASSKLLFVPVVFCATANRLAKSKRKEIIGLQFPVFPVAFVGHQQYRLVQSAQAFGHPLIQWRDSVARVNDKQEQYRRPESRFEIWASISSSSSSTSLMPIPPVSTISK